MKRHLLFFSLFALCPFVGSAQSSDAAYPEGSWISELPAEEYEKPYFIEENFYYPKNDCEDRAVFYAFLIRNLLGLDVHLVHFPGHECTAVCFGTENVIGSGYRYEGKTYIICDPTYIGANIGQCMPQYEGMEPKVELW